MIKYVGLYIQPNQQKHTYNWITNTLSKNNYVKIIIFDSTISKQEFDLILDIIGMLIIPGGLPGYEYIETMHTHNHYLSYAIDKYKNYSKKGIYKVIWGICFGFQQFSYVESNMTRDEILDKTDSVNYFTPIEKINDSKLFNGIIQNDTQINKYNNHMYSVLPEKFSKSRLSDEYIITHTSTDHNNIKFIASYEHIRYPFFLFQWHPEHDQEYFYHKLLFNQIDKTSYYRLEIPNSILSKIM
jgi:anthranilate/para-aminobenzoate synthase component II